jgi:hypothetical protein
MSRLFRATLAVALAVALVGTAVAPAGAAPLPPPTSHDAPLSQQPIPESADNASSITPAAIPPCPYPVATKAPAGTTYFSGVPIGFPTTDGDVLSGNIFAVGATRYVAFGGNFHNVIGTNGARYPASNFAIVNEATGAMVYAGRGINSYVWSIKSGPGVVYIGGDFTTFGGVSRAYIAALNFPTGTVSRWNPGSSSKVRAIALNTTTVFYGGASNHISAVRVGTGSLLWNQTVSGGPVMSMLITPHLNGLFVGGLFEQVGQVKQHGLVELYPLSTGAVFTPFKPVLKPDSGVGREATWDGQEALSLDWDTHVPSVIYLVLGWGGGTTNGIAQVVPGNGHFNWMRDTEGDTQGVAVIGNVYMGGNHRGHANNIGCPYANQTTSFATDGTILSYINYQLSGNQANVDGGNNGIRPVLNDPVTHRVFLMGAFTHIGAHCDPTGKVCSGGTLKQSIAEFAYSG